MADLLCLGEPLIEFNQQPDGRFLQGYGGDVSNAAIAAARYGASVGMLSRLGEDFFGDSLCGLWDRENVGHAHIVRDDAQETGLYFVTHDDRGHHFTYRRRRSAASFYTPADLPTESLKQARMFYASGISLAVSVTMRDAVIEAAQTVKAAGGLFAFDPNLRTALWPLADACEATHRVMEFCDIALPGYDDARQMTGRDTPQAILEFYHDLGASVVALTMGDQGVVLSDPKGVYEIAPVPVDAVDATGAGDCFNGAFMAGVLGGASFYQAAIQANEAAAASVTHYGAVPSSTAVLCP